MCACVKNFINTPLRKFDNNLGILILYQVKLNAGNNTLIKSLKKNLKKYHQIREVHAASTASVMITEFFVCVDRQRNRRSPAMLPLMVKLGGRVRAAPGK